MGGAPAPLAHLLSGTPSSVRRSGLCPAASEGALLWPRDSCLRTGTQRGGAGSSTPPSNCPAPLSGPAPAPPARKGPSGTCGGEGRGGRGRRLSQWQRGRCTKSPMGAGLCGVGGGPGAGPGSSGRFLRNHERGRMQGESPTPGPVQEMRGRRIRVKKQREMGAGERKRAKKKNRTTAWLWEGPFLPLGLRLKYGPREHFTAEGPGSPLNM